MSNTHFLKVFVDTNDNFGDAASVIINEGRRIADAKRQELAAQLNTGETIFINDIAKADISVMHPQGEIDFAGVGVLATAWLLHKITGKEISSLHGRGGEIKVWQENGLTWVRADLSTMPPWNFRQLDSPEAVEHITLDETKTVEHTLFWAWLDESKGLIRARTFASDWDIPEAQGNGSGSMVLAARLNRPIEIKHGEGSAIFAKPAGNGFAEIGGHIIEEKSA